MAAATANAVAAGATAAADDSGAADDTIDVDDADDNDNASDGEGNTKPRSWMLRLRAWSGSSSSEMLVAVTGNTLSPTIVLSTRKQLHVLSATFAVLNLDMSEFVVMQVSLGLLSPACLYRASST